MGITSGQMAIGREVAVRLKEGGSWHKAVVVAHHEDVVLAVYDGAKELDPTYIGQMQTWGINPDLSVITGG